MARDCVPCGHRRRAAAAPAAARAQPASAPKAMLAGAASLFEVFNAGGVTTGRRYNSAVRASDHARRIGGTVRPVG